MSGGSLDYVYQRIGYAAEALREIIERPDDEDYKRDHKTELGRFARTLEEFSKLLHDVECDLSGDSSLEKEDYELMDKLNEILVKYYE